MSRAPLVTIGLPFHNEERRIAEAIRSICRQTMTDFELLVVDDGSSDGSVAVARSFDDPRIRVISDGRRRHLAARLNQITDEARGTFVARMDADDVCHEKRIEEQLTLLTNGGFEAVGTWAGLMTDEGEPFGVVEAHPESVSPMRVLLHGVLPHPTLLASRAWFARHRYDERLSRTEDRDLWCRTAAHTRFSAVPRPLYVLRVEAAEKGFVPTYLESQRQFRTLILRRGPDMVGWSRTVEALGASALRSTVMTMAHPLGLVERLVRRRGRAPRGEELALIREAIAGARRVT